MATKFTTNLQNNMNNFWQKLNKPIFVLAPMADVTDCVFREIINKYGKPDVFWTEFLSSDGAFFDTATHANESAGTVTGATIIATLVAAELVFRAQTKPNGQPLGIRPDRILSPPGYDRVFMAAMNSTFVVGSTHEPAANVFAGNYKVFSSDYLVDTTKTGWSAVKWYFLANPSVLAMIETVFLNGREAPVIETSDTAFNTLGIQMRGYHDFGVNLQEYRAAVQGAGA